MKRIILILAIIFSVKSYSQDPAFTQSFMVPESINPSFSGFYETTKAGLLYKNQQYGDSALNPSRIFSKASAVEQLLVRIDDKLNRIKKGAK